jgi:mannosylglucosylglycerate synthase
VRTPVAVLLSYRLGGADGVSVEARKWEWALRSLGFETRRVAGELEDGGRRDDTPLPFLRIGADVSVSADFDALDAAIAGADVVVVENLLSLPVNASAATGAAAVLARFPGRIVLHHHDLPWERPELTPAPGLPPPLPGALHVTISDHARATLAERGIEAVTIRNAFDPEPAPGDRDGTRRRLGLGEDEQVVVQPTRAIPRKGIRAGLGLAAQLADANPSVSTRYWLTGPDEDGYGPEVERILAGATVPVTRGRTERVADVYAAADLVVMPSSWEGFGNPVAEAMLAERPVACAPYPVLSELLALGVEVLPIGDALAVASFVEHPDLEVLRRNHQIVGRELSLARLPGRLAQVFAQVGWDRW